MDVSPTLATGGNDAAVEPSRPSRRAAPAPQAPPLRPDPEFMHNAVANELVARFSAYQNDPALTSSASDMLRRAYAVAREAHEGQKRASGEPYIDHPVAVAGLLLDLPAGASQLDLRSREPATSGDALEHNGDLRPISVRFADMRLEPLTQ